METIPAIHNQQIFLALNAAARVIERQNAKLRELDIHYSLHLVPAFNGTHFCTFLKDLAEYVPMDEKEKTEWKDFLDKNVKTVFGPK